jgi:hypothetical protein
MFDHALPTGLEVHCDKCNIVIPSDSPRPAGGDCEFVATHKLAWFNPNETIAGQFCMAAAAWSLIYHEPLTASLCPASTEYHRQFKDERKSHYVGSEARRAMASVHIEAALTPILDDVKAESRRQRDEWLYQEEIGDAS